MKIKLFEYAQTKGEIRDSVDETLNQLDTGIIRVCEKNGKDWLCYWFRLQKPSFITL